MAKEKKPNVARTTGDTSVFGIGGPDKAAKTKAEWDEWDRVQKQLEADRNKGTEKKAFNEKETPKTEPAKGSEKEAPKSEPAKEPETTTGVVEPENDGYEPNRYDSKQRDDLESQITKGGGKERPIRGILPSFLLGDYGDISLASVKSNERYNIYEPDVSPDDTIDMSSVKKMKSDYSGISKNKLKKINKDFAKSIKDAGMTISKPDEDGKVYLIDRTGEKVYAFKSKKDANNFVNNHYSLAGIHPSSTYSVKKGGESYGFESKDEAKNYAKQLNRESRKERLGAWMEFLHRLSNSAITDLNNLNSDMAGEGRPYQSLHSQDMAQRLKSNNEMYYANEEGKNVDIRNLVKQLNQQNLDRVLSTDMYKNWSPDQRQAYMAWAATKGAGPSTELLLAIASGKTTADSVARKWNTRTKQELAKNSVELEALETAVKKALLDNRITEAQADVVRELVAEQLRSAKLTNNRQIQQMATSSVDSIAKIIDSIIPG